MEFKSIDSDDWVCHETWYYDNNISASLNDFHGPMFSLC